MRTLFMFAIVFVLLSMLFTSPLVYSASAQVTSDPSSFTNNPDDEEFTYFVNSVIGIVAQYPVDWELWGSSDGEDTEDEIGTMSSKSIQFRSPATSLSISDAFVDIIVEELAPGISAEEYNTARIDDFGNQIGCFCEDYIDILGITPDSPSITLAGSSATRVEYSLDPQASTQGETARGVQLWSVIDGKAYIINYRASIEDNYEVYLPTVQKITDSLIVVGSSTNNNTGIMTEDNSLLTFDELTFNELTHAALNTIIRFPADWTESVHDTEPMVDFYPEPSNASQLGVRIFKSDLPLSSTVDDFATIALDEIDNTGNITSLNSTTLAGYPALTVIYEDQADELKKKEIWMIAEGNTFYSMLFWSPPERFERYLAVVEAMADSMKIATEEELSSNEDLSQDSSSSDIAPQEDSRDEEEEEEDVEESDCDSSYPDVCIPSAPPDLDCGDVDEEDFRVREPDPHRFDNDNDGIGCES